MKHTHQHHSTHAVPFALSEQEHISLQHAVLDLDTEALKANPRAFKTFLQTEWRDVLDIIAACLDKISRGHDIPKCAAFIAHVMDQNRHFDQTVRERLQRWNASDDMMHYDQHVLPLRQADFAAPMVAANSQSPRSATVAVASSSQQTRSKKAGSLNLPKQERSLLRQAVFNLDTRVLKTRPNHFKIFLRTEWYDVLKAVMTCLNKINEGQDTRECAAFIAYVMDQNRHFDQKVRECLKQWNALDDMMHHDQHVLPLRQARFAAPMVPPEPAADEQPHEKPEASQPNKTTRLR